MSVRGALAVPAVDTARPPPAFSQAGSSRSPVEWLIGVHLHKARLVVTHLWSARSTAFSRTSTPNESVWQDMSLPGTKVSLAL